MRNRRTQFADFYVLASQSYTYLPDQGQVFEGISIASAIHPLEIQRYSTFTKGEYTFLMTFLEAKQVCSTRQYFCDENLELAINRVGEISGDFIKSFKAEEYDEMTVGQSIHYLLSLADETKPDYWRPWENSRNRRFQLGNERYRYQVIRFKENPESKCFKFDERIINDSNGESIYSGRVTGYVYADYLTMEEKEEVLDKGITVL